MSLIDPQLQAFMAICREGSVHAAAESLHITQTAATQRLKGLEAKLDVSLFVRSRRGMKITAEGKELLRYCKTIESLGTETLSKIQGTGDRASVTLAINAPSSTMQAKVMPIVKQLYEEFPEVRLQMNYDDSHQGVAALKSGAVQFAIIEQHQLTKELSSKPLTSENYVLVATKQWQHRSLDDIIKHEPIVDFNKSDNLTFSYLKTFHLIQDINEERHYANHPEAIAELVVDGLGYTVLEESFLEHLPQRDELLVLNEGNIYKNEVALAWYPRPRMPDYMKQFIQLIS